MASKDEFCKFCGLATKYRCIECKDVVCNRSECSVPELDEETDGWIEQARVSYCNDCFLTQKQPPIKLIDDDEDEDEVENEDDVLQHQPTLKRKSESGKINTGRRSMWTSEHLDDMVDIITNSEQFKRKLIFTNIKTAKNTDVYRLVLQKIKERQALFPFTIKQIRNKFKWCVATCKKVALTIQTKSGIQRFIEDKGFGKWFDALFPLIKSRDSYQPDQAVEPSASSSKSTSLCFQNTPVVDVEDNESEEDDRQERDRSRANLFVPSKKRKLKERTTWRSKSQK